MIDLTEIWRALAANETVPAKVAETHVTALTEYKGQTDPRILVDLNHGLYREVLATTGHRHMELDKYVLSLISHLREAHRRIVILYPRSAQEVNASFNTWAAKNSWESAELVATLKAMPHADNGKKAEAYITARTAKEDDGARLLAAHVSLIHPDSLRPQEQVYPGRRKPAWHVA